MRILHVTECFGAGVGRAIRNAVQLLPEHEHHLLWAGEEIPEAELGLRSRTPLHDSIPARVLQVRKLVRSLMPDVVHAHSSWAGVFTRLLPLGVPVIYQPHAYAFEDQSRSPLTRNVFHTAERILAWNTDLVAALSDAEERAAFKLSQSTPVARIPNVSMLRPTALLQRDFPGSRDDCTVVMVGRISPQKDPLFFAEVASLVRQQRPGVRFAWIGDGDAELRQSLESEGIIVTGWLDRKQLAKVLEDSSLYFHSAAYEGFPLSVLDAAAFSLPIVVRDIPAFDGLDFRKGLTPGECAEYVIRTILEPEEWSQGVRRSEHLDNAMSPESHAAALNHAYALLMRKKQ